MAERATAEWIVLAPGLAVIVAVALWLSVIDWREHRLPNNIVGPLAGGVAAWIFALGIAADDGERAISSLIVGAAAFGVFFLLVLAGGMGGGDAKFAFPLVAALAWLGSGALQVALVAMIISAGVAAVVVLLQGKGRDHRVAYGPYMTFGLVCGIAWGLIG